MNRTLRSDPARTRRSRRIGALGTSLLLTAALGSALVACGSDSKSSTPTTGAGGGHATTVSAEACTGFAELSALTFQMPEEPSDMAAFLEEEMVPVVTTVVEGLPHEAMGAGETVLDAYTEAATTGNPEPVMAPEVMAAQAEIGQALFDGCDGNRLDIAGVDYAFEGLPDEIPAGHTTIAFTDEGNEEHEIMIVKLADGEDLTLDELLDLPEEEVFSKVQPVAVTWGAPGETGYTAMDLEPGTYFALCNIPIGGGEQGAPHHTAGMKQTFVVS